MNSLKEMDIRSIKALYEYMEDHEEAISPFQWEKVIALIDQAWNLVERRAK